MGNNSNRPVGLGRITKQDVVDALTNLKQIVFEVTDDCNLACKYCVYGDLYAGRDKRDAGYMLYDDAKAIIDYLARIWSDYPSLASTPITYINFYGGEPLLNFSLIKKIVEYIESLQVSRFFHFSITSNCLLLNRYLDYLVEKDFILLCSLDGDAVANGYRVRKDGSPSFSTVYGNIKQVQEQYPQYFDRNVFFNAVVHNLNNVQAICDYFQTEFGKIPKLSELSSVNVRVEKRDIFNKTFKNVLEDIRHSPDYERLSNRISWDNPENAATLDYIESFSGNVFTDYIDLLLDEKSYNYIPTGTCLPFSKKIFVKVDGKILPCEKIPHSISFGNVSNGKVSIDIHHITTVFNKLLDSIEKQCCGCARKSACSQCVYQMEGYESYQPRCKTHISSSEQNGSIKVGRDNLYKHPQLYRKAMETLVYE